MPDLDELLSGGVADAAAESVDTTPDLATLRTRGVRRRQLRRTALAGLAVAAVVAVAFQLPGTGRPEPANPAPPPSPAPSPTGKADQISLSTLTPDEIVDHPKAVLTGIVVSPTDAEVRASVWQLCNNDRCGRRVTATAVTADGYQTRAVVRGGQPWELKPLGSTGFVLTKDGLGTAPRLLSPDGSISAIEVDSGPARPLADGEVAVGVRGSGVRWAQWLGVDPVTARAHRFPVPVEAQQLGQQTDGRLEVTTAREPYGTEAFRWSEDGGASWKTYPLPKNSSSLYGFVPSAQPSTIALVEGGDGATVFPFDAVHVSRDGGQTWERVSEDERPAAYVATTAVLPDGSLLAHLASWADDRGGKPAERSHGFYVGADWSDLRPVDMGAPFDSVAQAPEGPQVLAVHMGSDAVTIYAASEGESLFRTTDNGVTWEEVQTR